MVEQKNMSGGKIAPETWEKSFFLYSRRYVKLKGIEKRYGKIGIKSPTS